VPVDGLGTLLSDPLATYPALAALLLAAVALATGVLRGDAVALTRSVPVLWLFGLGGITYLAVAALPLLPAAAAEPLAGLVRLPVYLYALAYGAIPGVILAALLAAFVPVPHVHPWGPAVLGLEVLVIGWLAVWPSPRVHRACGPIYALLGYALAWATLGISAQSISDGPFTLEAMQDLHGSVPWGVAIAALMLSLVSPAAYQRAFPDSRLRPEDYEASRGERRRGPRRATPRERTTRLVGIDLPPRLERTSRPSRRHPDDG
jgi:hypothetical protein